MRSGCLRQFGGCPIRPECPRANRHEQTSDDWEGLPATRNLQKHPTTLSIGGGWMTEMNVGVSSSASYSVESACHGLNAREESSSQWSSEPVRPRRQGCRRGSTGINAVSVCTIVGVEEAGRGVRVHRGVMPATLQFPAPTAGFRRRALFEDAELRQSDRSQHLWPYHSMLESFVKPSSSPSRARAMRGHRVNSGEKASN
jgi:hypothetical protein